MAGRTYIPAEDLARFGCTLELDESGAFVDPPWRLNELIGFQAERARAWYAEGCASCRCWTGAARRCTAAMAASTGGCWRTSPSARSSR